MKIEDPSCVPLRFSLIGQHHTIGSNWIFTEVRRCAQLTIGHVILPGSSSDPGVQVLISSIKGKVKKKYFAVAGCFLAFQPT
jgi:hypothetical protein